MTTAEQVLDTAAQILADPRSWYRNDWNNEDRTAFCSLGALREARLRLGVHDDMHEADTPAGSALQAIVRERYPEFENGKLWPETYGALPPAFGEKVSISVWNDANGRRHAEVLEAFEKARAYAAEKGL